jgi:hypothetical protein
VRVRSWEEVEATLDPQGRLDGLPFMPEMRTYCGREFTVSRRIERTCEEIAREMRRIRDVVYLDGLRCDGTDHGGCDKSCFLIWKEAWLERSAGERCLRPEAGGVSLRPLPYESGSANGDYVCQSTELTAATSPLPWWDAGMLVRDVRAKTYSVPALARIIGSALVNRVRNKLTGRSYAHLEGRQGKTPTARLGLRAGDRVKVKPREAIVETLDPSGRNRGLVFTVEMLPFCGGTYRVLKRLDRMVHEPTRQLVDVEDTVILEDVICDGCHILRGGCPRANYHYWREIWLERITT